MFWGSFWSLQLFEDTLMPKATTAYNLPFWMNKYYRMVMKFIFQFILKDFSPDV